MRLILRCAVWTLALGLAFLLDRQSFTTLRTLCLYDHWGELREGLTAAKFLASGLGTLVVGLAVGCLDGKRGWRRARLLWVVALAAGAAAGGLKVVSGRERPSHLDQPFGAERLAFCGPAEGLNAPFQSFPSGHVTCAFATATCLAAFYPQARVVCYVVASTTGLNRVVKHQHFLSDVVAGAVLGYGIASWLLKRDRLRRWWQVAGSTASSPST
jgi:membrane-associated phospholipid phosphatase